MRKYIATGIIIILAIAIILFVTPLKTIRIEIRDALDDGTVYVLQEYLPDAIGYANGGLPGALIGNAVGGDHVVVSRGLYRFSLKGWKNQDITLHLYCLMKNATPEKLVIYVVNDFGELPSEQIGDPHDVSDIWYLNVTGYRVGTVTPEVGRWFVVNIPGSIVFQYLTEDKYISFMVVLSNENSLYSHFGIATYEYAEEANIAKPYITWKTPILP